MDEDHSDIPIILCFHGRGSSAKIFEIQSRFQRNELTDQFKLVPLDGPFVSDAGPGILPFFEGCEPYHSWTVPQPLENSSSAAETKEILKQSGGDAVKKFLDAESSGGSASAVNEIVINATKRHGRQRIIGVFGFSQGTRVVSGLLRQQHMLQRRGLDPDAYGLPTFKFGVLCNGGTGVANCVQLRPLQGENVPDDLTFNEDERITIPTLHIRGINDEVVTREDWEAAKRIYDTKTSRFMEVVAGHHLAQKRPDVLAMCDEIRRMAVLDDEDVEEDDQAGST